MHELKSVQIRNDLKMVTKLCNISKCRHLKL